MVRLVHVFVSTGRFASLDEMRRFVDPRYTADGDMIGSPFMREVDIAAYEPAGIEAIHAPAPRPLPELLADASYAATWVSFLDAAVVASEAICVFAPPNKISRPEGSSLRYCGAYPYRV